MKVLHYVHNYKEKPGIIFGLLEHLFPVRNQKQYETNCNLEENYFATKSQSHYPSANGHEGYFICFLYFSEKSES